MTDRNRIEEEYKGYLLCVCRFNCGDGFGEFTAFAMKLSEAGRITPPFAGRIDLDSNVKFTGRGAKFAAYTAIKDAVNAAIG